MNKQLKFSWGHIIAFFTIILMAYMTFIGCTYLFDGEFIWAGVSTFVIISLLTYLFIHLQAIKATDKKYDKQIIQERILFFALPFLFIALSFPFFHTWKVQKNSESIENQFKTAINSSREIFTEYEEYATKRISKQDSILKKTIAEKTTPEGSALYQQLGFTGNNDEGQLQNRLSALDLQLNGNFDELEKMAIEWIDKADQKTSVWNVFLIGNIREITASITEWHTRLQNYSEHILETERIAGDSTIAKFDPEGIRLQSVLSQFENINKEYTQTGTPNWPAYPIALLFYFAMLVPYIIQPRNQNNPYKLFGYQKWHTPTNHTETTIIDTGL